MEKGSQGQKIAQLADVIWMLLAAVIPFESLVGSHIVILITCKDLGF